MLVDFQVGNFCSFKGPVSLSLAAARPLKEFQDDNVFQEGRFRLLKSAAIYGANASGKSNLLYAFVTMRWLVLNSSKESQVNEPILVAPFKFDPETETQPCHFEIRFILDGILFRYGLEVDTRRIRGEWLFWTKRRAEVPLFLRRDNDIQVMKDFREGRGTEGKTRENALFLSVVAQFNGEIATRILGWFGSVAALHGLFDHHFGSRSIEMLRDPETRNLVMDFVRKGDVAIESLEFPEELASSEDEFSSSAVSRRPDTSKRDAPTRSSLLSIHAKYSKGERIGTASLDFDTEESAGTRKYFRLAGPILDALTSGGLVVVDELDSKLHPLLTAAIVRLFNCKQSNPSNAQLVFATHDTNLLRCGRLRRDQVWFVEKNQEEATDLYSLVEIRLPKGSKVRNDAALERNYIAGRYGAVPFVGDLRDLLKQRDDGKAD